MGAAGVGAAAVAVVIVGGTRGEADICTEVDAMGAAGAVANTVADAAAGTLLGAMTGEIPGRATTTTHGQKKSTGGYINEIDVPGFVLGREDWVLGVSSSCVVESCTWEGTVFGIRAMTESVEGTVVPR